MKKIINLYQNINLLIAFYFAFLVKINISQSLSISNTKAFRNINFSSKILRKKLSRDLCFGIFLISFLIFSCSKKDKNEDTAEYAYTAAMKKLKDKRYSEAAEEFDKIDDNYPLSKWSIKAQTISAYAYYKDNNYPEVIRVAEDFIRLNPASDDVSYMMYLKSMSYYNRIVSIVKSQDDAQAASYNFRELIARFPNSDYAADAKDRLAFVDDHIAGAKMSVGRYQMKTANYVGAIGNFNDVISRYSRTNQAPEAYLRLAEIYYKIGFKKQAEDKINELKENFADSKWAEYAQNMAIQD